MGRRLGGRDETGKEVGAYLGFRTEELGFSSGGDASADPGAQGSAALGSGGRISVGGDNGSERTGGTKVAAGPVIGFGVVEVVSGERVAVRLALDFDFVFMGSDLGLTGKVGVD
jgi:hypothetical protein